MNMVLELPYIQDHLKRNIFPSLQEASLRALKLSNGGFEAALDFLVKQQQNEAVNGLPKVSSSGKFKFVVAYNNKQWLVGRVELISLFIKYK